MNGKLAISRTFGDRDFKRFGVTAEPDIVRRELQEGDEYVILASDGVWDKLSNQNAMGVVRDSIAQCRRARGSHQRNSLSRIFVGPW